MFGKYGIKRWLATLKSTERKDHWQHGYEIGLKTESRVVISICFAAWRIIVHVFSRERAGMHSLVDMVTRIIEYQGVA